MSESDQQQSPFAPFQWSNYVPAKSKSSAISAKSFVPTPGFFPTYSFPSRTEFHSASLWKSGFDVESQVNSWGFGTETASGRGMTKYQRLGCFSVFILAGLFLILFSFMNLSLSIIWPRYFVLPFTLGSVMLILSTGFLVGWKPYFSQLLSKERWKTTVFNGLIVGFNIYSALFIRIYFLTVAMFLVQTVAMITLGLSFFYPENSVYGYAARRIGGYLYWFPWTK